MYSEGFPLNEERDVVVKALGVLVGHLEQAAYEIREVLKDLAPEDIPRIDLGDLDAAGWLTYKTKTEAPPGSPAWIKNPSQFTQFNPPKVVFELVKAIKRSPGEKLVLGDMEYSFSAEGKFISRKPVKVEK